MRGSASSFPQFSGRTSGEALGWSVAWPRAGTRSHPVHEQRSCNNKRQSPNSVESASERLRKPRKFEEVPLLTSLGVEIVDRNMGALLAIKLNESNLSVEHGGPVPATRAGPAAKPFRNHHSTDLPVEFRRPRLSFGLAKAKDLHPWPRRIAPPGRYSHRVRLALSVRYSQYVRLALHCRYSRRARLNPYLTLPCQNDNMTHGALKCDVMLVLLQHQRNTELV